MQALSNSGLLGLWERGFGLNSLDRGLLALGAALPEVPPESLAAWPLGRKNRALLDLQRMGFGARLQAWASCSGCGEKMEFELDAATLMGNEPDPDAWRQNLSVRGRSFRLPASRDLALAARQSDMRAAEICLVERCRTDAGEVVEWSEEELREVGEALEAADPASEIRILLRCPGCSREWDEVLDVAAFLWAEIEAQAKRLLWSVHRLASVYGWSEAEVLSLSDARRSLYLEMVQA